MRLQRFNPKSRIKSFRYAFKGIAALFGGEPNMWIHLAAAFVVVFGAVWFDFSATKWMILTLVIGTVMAAEAFNSSIEKIADYACKGERNEMIGRVKDLAAAGVLITAIAAAVVGGLLFVPHLTTWGRTGYSLRSSTAR